MPEKEYEFGSATKGSDRLAGNPPGPGGAVSGKKAENSGKAQRSLISYTKPFLSVVIFAMVLGCISAVFSLIGPGKISEITNLIVNGMAGSIDLSAIVHICILLATLYGLSWLFGYLQSFILATVTQKLTKVLRTDISQKNQQNSITLF